MAESQANNEHTILDYLNEDCWQAVLQYVPLKCVIQSERVSRRWQEVVLVYLRRIRIGIGHHWFDVRRDLRYVSKVEKKQGHLSSFNIWTNKLGPSVIAFCCDNENSLKVIGENCPNLETLIITEIPEVQLMRSIHENFRWLKRICFDAYCGHITDRCISRFISHESLQELEIQAFSGFSGQCLINLKSTNLRTLSFKFCDSLLTLELLRAADRLSGLTKFELETRNNLYKNMHELLTKMPNLEHLNITIYYKGRINSSADNIFESICQMGSLKYLKVNLLHVTNENLQAVARSCKELRSLLLEDCSVSGRCLAAVCALAGATLTKLIVRCTRNLNVLTDDDVVACIRACPNLQILRVDNCFGLTRQLRVRAAAARRELAARRPLCLALYAIDPQIAHALRHVNLQGRPQTEHEDLLVML